MSDEVDLSCQSAPVNDDRRARKSRLEFAGSEEDGFITHLDPNCQSLYEAFRRGARLSDDGPCLGWHAGAGQPYTWLSYSACIRRSRDVAAGLIASGLSPGQGTRVGIYASNCVEWVLVEQGCYCFNMVLVPLYDTLARDACSLILRQTELSTVVVDDSTKVITLLDVGPDTLVHIVVIKRFYSPRLNRQAKEKGIRLSFFSDIEAVGAETALEDCPPGGGDMACISYTSGTSGDPLGVMVTHSSVMSVIGSHIRNLEASPVVPGDTYISYLPLAHNFERVMLACLYISGGSIGFSSGDISLLLDDLCDLRPTIMMSVPRLFNRFYVSVWAKVSHSRVKHKLLKMALSAKKRQLRKGNLCDTSFWDWLVLRKIRAVFGGRIRLLLSGSAPAPLEVLVFVRCVFGCALLEGYGLTETMAACCATLPGDRLAGGHVGAPLPCCHIKLIDVPMTHYRAEDGQGEICIRGPCLFSGYYRNPERTRQAMDEQGWFRSGDIGQWLPNGCLRVIDRRKDIFKLSQGIYVAPVRIEHALGRSHYVNQVFVHGDSFYSCVVAVVVPDEAALKELASQRGMVADSLEDLCKSAEIKNVIMEDLKRRSHAAKLQDFEYVCDIYLYWEAFCVYNGLLTPTMKLKRPALRQFFEEQLDEMYSSLP